MNHDEVEKEELKRWQQDELISAFERRSGFAFNFQSEDSEGVNQNIKKTSKPTWRFKRVFMHNYKSVIESMKGLDCMFFIKEFVAVRSVNIHAVIVYPVGSKSLSDTKFDINCKQVSKHKRVSQSDFIKAINDNFKGRFNCEA